jgi:LmbE family N-acetylglucosaminyl deacetylase
VARSLHAGTATATVAIERAEAVRMREAAQGARVLGATLRVLDELTPEACTALFIELRPQVVITHHLDDVHPDHRRAADCVVAAVPRAVIDCGHPRRLYTCDSYESLTLHSYVTGRTIIDVTSTFATKMQALAMHASQPLDHFIPMAERLARSWGARIGVAHAEAFDPLPVLGRLPSAPHL